MKRVFVLVLAIALAAFYAGTLTVRAAQPHMRTALQHLEAALKATSEAIGHVKEGMEFAAGKHHH